MNANRLLRVVCWLSALLLLIHIPAARSQSPEELLLGQATPSPVAAERYSWIRYRGRTYGLRLSADPVTGTPVYQAIHPDGRPVSRIAPLAGRHLVWAYQMLHSVYFQPYKLDDLQQLRDSVQTIRLSDRTIRYLSKFQDKLMQAGVAATAGYFFGPDKAFQILADSVKGELIDVIKNAPVIAARQVAHAIAWAGQQRLEQIIDWVRQLQAGRLATRDAPADFEAIRSHYQKAVWTDTYMWPASELLIRLQPETDALSQITRLLGVVGSTAIDAAKPGKDASVVLKYGHMGLSQLLSQGLWLPAIARQVKEMAEYLVTTEQRMNKWKQSVTGLGDELPEGMPGLFTPKLAQPEKKTPKQPQPERNSHQRTQQAQSSRSATQSDTIRFARVFKKGGQYRVIYGLYGGAKRYDRFVLHARYRNKRIKVCERENLRPGQYHLKKIVCTLPEAIDGKYRFIATLYHRNTRVGQRVTEQDIHLSPASTVPSPDNQTGIIKLGQFVSIPSGHFRMGDVSNNGYPFEYPVHRVDIDDYFRLAEKEVTVEMFRQFVEATGFETDAEKKGGCLSYKGRRLTSIGGLDWRSPGFEQTDQHPVVCVSWNDAQAYIAWVNKNKWYDYRLPTEAEWEYAARAGSETPYSWGNDIGTNRANCDGCGSRWDGKKTAPVGSFPPNAHGLYDMHGNVWEWVQDCAHSDYQGAPADGSAWNSGRCKERVRRGGSWRDKPGNLRSAIRSWDKPSNSYNFVGFRLIEIPRPGFSTYVPG